MRSEIYRIIDVNLNRAREGLRVVEEVCRFVLEDKWLTLKVKKMRGRLSKIIGSSDLRPRETKKSRISDKILRARKSFKDVGRELYTRHEGERGEILSIFQSNIKRGQEAVRCLEEFSKIISPDYGKKFKAIRFDLYELEKLIIPRLIKAVKLNFGLYIVTDPKDDHLATARKVLAAGVKIIQLRDKKMGKEEYLRIAKQMAGSAKRSGAAFILNDHWDLINKVGADGVHLGQDDIKLFSLANVRRKIGEEKIVGISTHSLLQAKAAARAGADYISVGPIFATPSKPNVVPVGIKLLKQVLRRVKIPVVAIGGIDRNNVEKVLKAGCKRAAVIRAAKEAKTLLALLEPHQE